ncbi:MAG: hypothetical protein RIS35_1654, partial [Pseudomonadota bacterium]
MLDLNARRGATGPASADSNERRVVADGFGTEVIEYGAWRAGLAEALS